MRHIVTRCLLLESTNLIKLIDDAIQANVSLSAAIENSVSQVSVLEKHLEDLTCRLEDEVRIKEQVQQHLERLSEQLKNLEEEAGLTTDQLHQVQEELERYFILTRKQSEMLDKSAKLQERTIFLLATANR